MPPKAARDAAADSAAALLRGPWLTPDDTPATPAFLKQIQDDTIQWWSQHRRRDLPWREVAGGDRGGGGDHSQLRYEPYQIWVSEVMSQQTRMDTVLQYFPAWMAAFPTVERAAAASEDDVRRVWAGLGFYRRALYLHRGAKYVVAQFQERHPAAAAGRPVAMPATYAELLRVPGIGPYTAAAIASMCHGEPVASVDGNLVRVLSRLRGQRGVDPKRPPHMAAAMAWGAELMLGGGAAAGAEAAVCREPGPLNQGLMEIGALVCRPAGPPLCGRCPLATLCAARRMADDGAIAAIEGVIPMRGSKTKVRNDGVVCLVHELPPLPSSSTAATGERRFIVVKRPEGGLLGGMLEFPCLTVSSVPAEEGEEVVLAAEENGGPIKKRSRPRASTATTTSAVAGVAPTQAEAAALKKLSLEGTPTAAAAATAPVAQDKGAVRHIFSHINMHVRVYGIVWEDLPSDGRAGRAALVKGARSTAEDGLCCAVAALLDREEALGRESIGSGTTTAAKTAKTAKTAKRVAAIDRIAIMTESELRDAAPSRLCLKILQQVGSGARASKPPPKKLAKGEKSAGKHIIIV